jgi:uracil-DNA glycosylase
MSDTELAEAVAAARACTRCTDLPRGPLPVLRLSRSARVLIMSQAPSTRVHETGIPWNDASGDRLRLWLGMTRDAFYDQSRIAIMPAGLCYPGRLPNGGDAPPRAICAPYWHPRLLPLLTGLRLTLLVGTYSQALMLGAGPMSERVARFADYLPAQFPLPHPSWRTVGWERRNPWFATDVLPALRAVLAAALA